MSEIRPEWYYVGHYGQLGPLTQEQMAELAADGVITAQTYVWRAGMSDWLPAEAVAELQTVVQRAVFEAGPPPFVSGGASGPPTMPSMPTASPGISTGVSNPYVTGPAPMQAMGGYGMPYGIQEPISDKSRILAGILNIVIPGVGRMYLGYSALGVIQFLSTFITCGIAYLWGLVDGILMIIGSVSHDGYGRRLKD